MGACENFDLGVGLMGKRYLPSRGSLRHRKVVILHGQPCDKPEALGQTTVKAGGECLNKCKPVSGA